MEKINAIDPLLQKMDEITKLADEMVLLPVRPSISPVDFIEFEFFDVDGFTKYQDDISPALRTKIKNLYPNLGPNEISKLFLQELEGAKTRLRLKGQKPNL